MIVWVSIYYRCYFQSCGFISWMSKQQPVVALSTIEAEYMASTHACKEAIWLRRLCYDIDVDVGQITICCDS